MPNDGKTYDFEPVRYAGSTPQIQALAIKELEIAAFSDSAFALAITNAHLDVKIVADVLQTGQPGYLPGEYVVAKDGPIKTDRRSEGQAGRHQRDRLRGRFDDARDAAQDTASRTAT